MADHNQDAEPTRSTASSAPLADGEREELSDKYDEPRAHVLRERYHATLAATSCPSRSSRSPKTCSASLSKRASSRERDAPPGRAPHPCQRRGAGDAPRFTIAHELGHWICQCVGVAQPQPIYCRAEEIGVDAEAKALEREANIFAANLVMPEAAAGAGREPVRRQRRGARMAALQPRPIGREAR